MSALPFWTDGEERSAEQGEVALGRVLAGFGGWSFRVTLVVLLMPLYNHFWGQGATAAVLIMTAVELVLVSLIQPVATAIAFRARAHATVGDVRSLGGTVGTGLVLAAMLSALSWAAWWAIADRLALLPVVGASADLEVRLTLQLFGVHFGMVPLLAVLLACADATGSTLRPQVRGGVGLAVALGAFGVILMGWGPPAWPVVLAALSLGATVVLFNQLGARKLLRNLNFSPRELGGIARATWSRPLEVAGSQVPLFAAMLAVEVGGGSGTCTPALAAALVAAGISGWVRSAARLMEPEVSNLDLQGDPHRVRWRFRRTLDAALLTSAGASLLLAAYGGLAMRAWLGLGEHWILMAICLAAWVVASAVQDITSLWLARVDMGRRQLPGHVIQVAAALALGPALQARLGWEGMIAALVGLRLILTLILGLRWLCGRLSLSTPELVWSYSWRLVMVLTPAVVTAVALTLMKTPRAPRAWAIQVLIVSILYVVPAFAAWNLMDTRHDKAA